ncbi:zinc finger and BTB domain-containing protein 14-like [Centroberyx affinis]|uniref:zinc finger and BTB domain-containing protein 14-like n=1 Tax=Centroberyx affinis TaxID=166261 RepID=UPI003A5C0C61
MWSSLPPLLCPLPRPPEAPQTESRTTSYRAGRDQRLGEIGEAPDAPSAGEISCSSSTEKPVIKWQTCSASSSFSCFILLQLIFVVMKTFQGQSAVWLTQGQSAVWLTQGQSAVWLTQGQSALWLTQGQSAVWLTQGQSAVWLTQGQSAVWLTQDQSAVWLTQGQSAVWLTQGYPQGRILTGAKRDVSSEEKEKFPYDIVKMALPPDAQLAADSEVQVLGEHDDPPTTDDLVEASANQELDKSPSAALRVQEAILKELTNEDVHKVTCYDQDVVSEMEAEPKELGAGHHATQTLSFTDSMGEVKDEQPPGWSTATTDMKFEYLLYGHRETLACQVCGKSFLDENRLRKHEKLHSAERPFVCEICSKAFTTHAHLKEHLKIHTGFKPYRCDVCGKSFIRAPDLKKHERVHSNERPFACQMCDKAFKHKSHLKDHERRHRGEKPFVCSSCTKAFAKASDLKRHENNMHSERKQLNLQSDTETLQAAAMAAEEQQLENMSCS